MHDRHIVPNHHFIPLNTNNLKYKICKLALGMLKVTKGDNYLLHDFVSNLLKVKCMHNIFLKEKEVGMVHPS